MFQIQTFELRIPLFCLQIFQPNNTLQQAIFPINTSASAFFGHQPQQNPELHSNASNGTMTQCSVDPLDTAICPKLNTHLPQINQFVETVPPQVNIIFIANQSSLLSFPIFRDLNA